MNREYPLRCSKTLACLFVLIFASICAAATAPRQVLLLHSFDRDFAPFDVFTADFRRDLAQLSPAPVNFLEFPLHPAHDGEPLRDGELLDYLRSTFAGHHLDLVVPIGGPAATFAEHQGRQLFPTTPMIMAAVDQRHVESAALTPNETVVASFNDVPQVVETILRVLPQTTNIFVVIGNSPLEQFWRGELGRELQRFKDQLKFAWSQGLSFTQILELCAELPERSAILYVIFSGDSNGVPYAEDHVLPALHAVANAPIFGLQSTQLGRGIVGGPLMSINDLSRKTAEVAVRIFDGESPGDIKTPPQAPGPPMFDWRELRRWGIDENRLPPGSIVSFRSTTAWEQYKWYIASGVSLVVVETLLVLVLLTNRVKRRRAEQSLGESKNQLGAILVSAAEGILTVDERGAIESLNPAVEKMFGCTAADVIGQNISVLVPNLFGEQRDPAGNKARIVTPETSLGRETTGRRKDGSSFPIDFVVSEIVLSNRRIFTIVVRDISERKRTEEMERDFRRQLVQTQEAERARLARELHDDISQRLARLAIEASLSASERPHALQTEDATEIHDELVHLSEDVHTLAYKLHPALLERLGLTCALKLECETFSVKESIVVGLQLGQIPANVPHDVALCLFRVNQEALRNVARHSGAETVEVSLRSRDGGIQLAVIDTGVGFDPGKEFQRASLGLASMRERVELLGGRLDVESAPGRGTTVLAWAPLNEIISDQADSNRTGAFRSLTS